MTTATTATTATAVTTATAPAATYADLDRRWRQAVADRDEHDRQVAAWRKRTPRYGHPNEETVARSDGGKRAALTRRIIAIENAIDELRGR